MAVHATVSDVILSCFWSFSISLYDFRLKGGEGGARNLILFVDFLLDKVSLRVYDPPFVFLFSLIQIQLHAQMHIDMHVHVSAQTCRYTHDLCDASILWIVLCVFLVIIVLTLVI